MGQVNGTCEVIKAKTTTVNLVMTAGGQWTPTIPGAKLSEGSGGVTSLSYSDSSGTLM
jgi:hypothetical protein